MGVSLTPHDSCQTSGLHIYALIFKVQGLRFEMDKSQNTVRKQEIGGKVQD
jgi:hypothetical protein